MNDPNDAPAADALRIIPELPSTTPNGRARTAALQASPVRARSASALVSYRSTGQLLIIGEEVVPAFAIAQRMRDRLTCTLMVTRSRMKAARPAGKAAESSGLAPLPPEQNDGVTVVYGELLDLNGRLGEFRATLATPEGEVSLAQYAGARGHFDLVLDLGATPRIRREIPPVGYYAPGDDEGALERALAEIPEMVGEFEKPKFFDYNPDICAHGASKLTGCRRCLDACPTVAITSIGDKIAVDPYLCQGGGSCATACPTGAITYVYPSVSDLLAAIRALLKEYRRAGGRHPSLLFHDAQTGRETIARISEHLPEHVIPFEVEEIGSLGMDAWLAALAYGANEVLLLATDAVAPSVRREVENQIEFTAAILAGMGLSKKRIRHLMAESDAALLKQLSKIEPQPELAAANFSAMDEKRTTIRMAVDHLYAQTTASKRFTKLPDGAPFGQINVDRKGCTLCMACVSVCPASALSDGGDLPQLSFTEWNCVQCGLCETACPEQVITRAPRFVYDAELRRTARILNEDKVFSCVSCGKPFSTQRMMDQMASKLSGHWMFQKPEAVRRLHMCEDCRVKDMFTRDGGMMDVHNKH